MEKYIIGYIDEQEGERIDFANLMDDIDEDENYSFEVLSFLIDENTTFDALIEEVLSSKMHCLIVDFQLSEKGIPFEGGDVILELKKRRPYFPSIIYTAKEGLAIEKVEGDILYKIVDKSVKAEQSKAKNFRNKIKALIESYRKRIQEAETELKHLKDKKNIEGLEDNEEERYIGLNHFLDETFGDGGQISKSYYSERTNERLDRLIEKTENLLEKLTN